MPAGASCWTPISQNSGVGQASVSFVPAVGQLAFGIMQPVFGVLALKRSKPFVLRCGAVLMALSLPLLLFCKGFWTLLAVLGLVLPSGTTALASGVVTASAGVGSTVLAPVMQALAAAFGLLGTALFLSVPALLLLPGSLYLCRPSGKPGPPEDKKEAVRLPALVGRAGKSRDYRYLLAGFFTCGFHMAIIETHLYTQITTLGFSQRTAACAFSVYGAAAMLGAVLSGGLCGCFPMKDILAALYASRVLMVLAFLALPKFLAVVFGFAVLLGLTGSATVPPTSGLTERLFGAEKLAALFGVVFLSHQIGSFFSAWLGGLCLTARGYAPVWLADAALSALAAIVSCRIAAATEKESPHFLTLPRTVIPGKERRNKHV